MECLLSSWDASIISEISLSFFEAYACRCTWRNVRFFFIIFFLSLSVLLFDFPLFSQIQCASLASLGTDHLTCRGEGLWCFFFVQIFFPGQHNSWNIYFFLSRKAQFFFTIFNIRLYDKFFESDYFFFLHQNQNIFFSNIGNQNIFLEKNHNPPCKLNGRALRCLVDVDHLASVVFICVIACKLLHFNRLLWNHWW